jgi:hypothetical protein
MPKQLGIEYVRFVEADLARDWKIHAVKGGNRNR